MPHEVTEWLQQSNTWQQSSFGETKTTELWETLAWLVICNGGWQVRGWGYIGGGDGPFQRGLDQDNALTLLQLSGTVDGICIGLGNDDILEPLNELILRWAQYMTAEFEKKTSGTDA